MKIYFSYKKMLCLALLLLLTCLGCLSARNTEDEDLYFVISLYENQQYDLALQQISAFEKQYQNSDFADVMTFLKANIGFAQGNYAISDSLYTVLLQKPLEPAMQCEALTNQAFIKYESRDFPLALQLLSRALPLTEVPDEKFKIYLLSGKSQYQLLDYHSAFVNILAALQIKPFENEASLQLINIYKALDYQTEGTDYITALILDTGFSIKYTEHLNVWLDYLLEYATYSEIDSLETLLERRQVPVSQTTTLRFIRRNYLQKDYAKALAKLQEITLYEPIRQYTTAQIYAEQGKYALADSLYLQVVNIDEVERMVVASYNKDLPLLAWLEHIKILFKTAPESALVSLKDFLLTNQDSSLYPDAMYLYGMLLYQNKQYNNAANALIKLKELPISPLAQQNVQIALGDIWFYAGMYDQSRFTYNRYLNLFPQGKYRAYATYCIALIDFTIKDYHEATVGINQLLTLPAIEPYREKTMFMLAEIDLFQANYTSALGRYVEINRMFPGSSETLYRIAQTLFFSEDFVSATSYLEQIKADSTNAFQVSLLSGNIYFNLKQYTKAVEAYDRALVYHHSEAESVEAKSYKALSLYRMGSFKPASDLYLQLSKEKESPESYLLMAAKAAYHAKDYQHATILFQQFITQYPTSSFYQNALANIANIWYNLGQYNKAVDSYIEVLSHYKQNRSFNDEEQQILAGVFANLQWCLKQSEDQAALDSLNTMIADFQSEYVKFELQYLLLKIYYGSGEWDDVINMADQLRSQFPQRESTEIKRLVAGSLVKINRFSEADSIYQSVYKIEPTATILSEWAVLDIQQGATSAALEKYERSLALDTSAERFMTLLTFVDENIPDSLYIYWIKWQSRFSPMPDILQLVWLRWNFQHSHWTECLALIPLFANSSQQDILAEVQTIHAISKYQVGDYQKALIELLKTIYLYADYTDFVIQVKITLVKTYLALNLPLDARRYYDEISSSLTAQEQEEFGKLLNITKAKDDNANSD